MIFRCRLVPRRDLRAWSCRWSHHLARRKQTPGGYHASNHQTSWWSQSRSVHYSRLMFPPHTLPGGSWHTFILGKLWGAIRGLGEIFSSIFGLLIVGRLVWYLIKVLMNCSYIHRCTVVQPSSLGLFVPKSSSLDYTEENKSRLRKDPTMTLLPNQSFPYEIVYSTLAIFSQKNVSDTDRTATQAPESLFRWILFDAVTPFLIWEKTLYRLVRTVCSPSSTELSLLFSHVLLECLDLPSLRTM